MKKYNAAAQLEKALAFLEALRERFASQKGSQDVIEEIDHFKKLIQEILAGAEMVIRVIEVVQFLAFIWDLVNR